MAERKGWANWLARATNEISAFIRIVLYDARKNIYTRGKLEMVKMKPMKEFEKHGQPPTAVQKLSDGF